MKKKSLEGMILPCRRQIRAVLLLVVGSLCGFSVYQSRNVHDVLSQRNQFEYWVQFVTPLRDENKHIVLINGTDIRSYLYWNLTRIDNRIVATALHRFRDQHLIAIGTNDGFLFGDHLSHILTQDSLCGVAPGQGIEEDAGYKLLVEKIRISMTTNDNDSSSLRRQRQRQPRMFCGIYSYSGKREQVQVQAATWGHKCDGWMVFSNETLQEWGIYALQHQGAESYDNMWQKVRSLWKFVHQHFQDDFDYFYLGGDDTYLLVDNVKEWLQTLDDDPNMPRHMGQWLPGKAMVAGGPGYILNAAALKIFVQEGLPSCFVGTKASYEDRLISRCLAHLGIMGNHTDTRDSNGEQRFHDASPSMLYTFRASTLRGSSYLARTATTWEDLPHPDRPQERVGPKHGLEAAAAHSFSFHNIYNPQYMARIHAMLCPDLCPKNSPMGRGLRQHLPPQSFFRVL